MPVKPQSLKHSNISHNSIYTLSWNLGSQCNYKCSYCPDLLHNGEVKFPDKVLIISTVKHIIKNIPKGKSLYIEFTGGEVTLHPDLIEICRSLKVLGVSVGIISNGSKSINYWERLIPFIEHICLSYHEEFCREEHFEKVVQLISNTTTVHVNIMANNGLVARSIEYLQKLYASVPEASYELQPIILHDIESTRNLIQYDKEELELFSNFIPPLVSSKVDMFSTKGTMKLTNSQGESLELSAAQIVSSGKNSFTGFSCSAGIESLVIDYRGYIYRAKCNIGGPIGHITSRPIEIPAENIICDKLRCTCNFDITITKVNPNF
jgi:MoaA/NifB/PqqE/SkfB family radical SAM enzyme